MKKVYCFLLGSCLTLNVYEAQGQPGILKKDTSLKGETTFMEFDVSRNPIKQSKAKAFLQNQLGLSSNDELRSVRAHKDEVGFEHEFYQQYYKGVRVEYRAYGIHARNGNIESINGNFVKLGDINTKPVFTEKAALQKALDAIGATLYRWQDKGEEQWIKNHRNDASASFYPKGELLICEDTSKSTPHLLAYKFPIYALQPGSQQYVYIDAVSGRVIRKEAITTHTNATGTAATHYSGTQTITSDLNAGLYRLRETTRGNGVETYNMNHGVSFYAATDFTDLDNNWTTPEFNNSNKDYAALDAHWGLEKTYDYFKNVLTINGFDNHGSTIKGYIHPDMNNLGSIPDNAYWDSNLHIMVFGDGATLLNPVVSLDVTAHELGHGVTQYLVDPTGQTTLSSSGETGALNEGFSDIWAACVEYYTAPTKQTWKIGEEIMKNGFSCLRSLKNPKTEGYRLNYTTEGNYPDTYRKINWDNGNEVHTNSTVLSHWFYLLVNGGCGTNDNNNVYKVLGIDINKAAKIVYYLEGNYLSNHKTANYNDIKGFSISAANALYGSSSAEAKAVADAWYAVGVGSSNQVVSGNDYVCPQGTPGGSFSINNLPTGSTVTWSVSPSSAASINSSGVITRNGYGPATVYAVVSFGCSSTPTKTLSKNIWLGFAPVSTILGPSSICPNSGGLFTAGAPSNSGYAGFSSSYGWIYQPYFSLASGSTSSSNPISLLTPSNFTGGSVVVYAFNQCGPAPSPAVYGVGRSNTCPNGLVAASYVVSPNPASTSVSIAKVSASTQSIAADSTVSTASISSFAISDVSNASQETIKETPKVEIFDKYLQCRKTFLNQDISKSIDIRGLESGLYYLVITDSQHTERHQLVVQ